MEDRLPHSGLDMPYARKEYKKEAKLSIKIIHLALAGFKTSVNLLKSKDCLLGMQIALYCTSYLRRAEVITISIHPINLSIFKIIHFFCHVISKKTGSL